MDITNMMQGRAYLPYGLRHGEILASRAESNGPSESSAEQCRRALQPSYGLRLYGPTL